MFGCVGQGRMRPTRCNQSAFRSASSPGPPATTTSPPPLRFLRRAPTCRPDHLETHICTIDVMPPQRQDSFDPDGSSEEDEEVSPSSFLRHPSFVARPVTRDPPVSRVRLWPAYYISTSVLIVTLSFTLSSLLPRRVAKARPRAGRRTSRPRPSARPRTGSHRESSDRGSSSTSEVSQSTRSIVHSEG